MAKTETSKITDPNSMRSCSRCGGQHKLYQDCNIDERIIELNREKKQLADRCEQLERKQRCFDTVVELLAETIDKLKAESEVK